MTKKTYIVPTVIHCTFGCEMEVEATSEAEAIELIKNGGGDAEDGLDWDRCEFGKQEIGDWQPITTVRISHRRGAKAAPNTLWKILLKMIANRTSAPVVLWPWVRQFDATASTK